MANQRRTHRVAEKVREIVASQLLHSADERLSLVTVTAVTITKDLRIAKVYWNITGDEQRRRDAEEAFKSAAGYLRREVGKSLDAKFVPDLKFFYDTTLDTLEEVDRLLQKSRI